MNRSEPVEVKVFNVLNFAFFALDNLFLCRRLVCTLETGVEILRMLNNLLLLNQKYFNVVRTMEIICDAFEIRLHPYAKLIIFDEILFA